MRLLFTMLILVMFKASSAFGAIENGSLIRISEFPSQFVPTRNIDVWLPPGFSSETQYPVIYMHDGQMLFDPTLTWNKQAWEVDETVSRLMQTDQIPPVIIVAVWNGGRNRHSEYFPQKPFTMLHPDKQRALYNESKRGNEKLFTKPVYSDNYLRFLVEELMPYIEERYPVIADASYLMGSSMGGLISWYGLMEYPTEFAGAACLSTHWPGDFTEHNNPIPQHFEKYIQQNINKLTSQKLYFDYGTATLDAWYPPLQARIDKIFEEANYPVKQWVTKRFEGAEHTESAWAERLEYPLLFLLGENN